ncbi:hypothetical protein [Bacillus timonensis]|nr:hypothetical protein [Bacillus timonensis]
MHIVTNINDRIDEFCNQSNFSGITLVIPSNQSYGPHDVTDVFEENM